MKVVKGNKTFPFITGNDVIVTKGNKSMQTVDDALDSQQKEIDKLKSNVKYLYSYGGVGGNGSGNGGGNGSSTKSPSLVVTLGNKAVSNDGSPIVLEKPGKYTLNCNVRDNVNAETFNLRVDYGTSTSVDKTKVHSISPTSSTPNKYTADLNLQKNGELSIMWTDYNDELMPNGMINQKYIVNPHTFNVGFKYISNTGAVSEFADTNAYFMGSSDVLNPFIDVSYRIDLSDASNVEIQYSISGTDLSAGVVEKRNSDLSGDLKIKLEEITKNGQPLLVNSNMGTYNVNVTLMYSTNGNTVTDTYAFKFTLIPHDMYIDVRNPRGILYNSFGELIASKSDGIGGVPELYITQGLYSSCYVKVYEGEIRSNPEKYTVSCKMYDYLDDSSESESEIEYDEDNFSSTPSFVADTMTVDEQIESQNPFSIPFSTPGIKKIVFETTPSPTKGLNIKNDTIKYVFVKQKQSVIKKWSPATNIRDHYFRANNADETYSKNFPINEKFGNLPWELSANDTTKYTLVDEDWKIDSSQDTTILSIGFQYSKINSEGAEILRTYSSETSPQPDITLYSNKLFTSRSGEICIPYTDNFNKSTQNQYHLLQIIRTNVGTSDKPEYATYMYIDGIPESVKSSGTDKGKWFIGKIVLNNVNIAYNLINIQYLAKGKNTADSLIYQYWLKYKNNMLGQDISESEMKIFNLVDDIKFDGTDVKMDDETTVKNLAPYMPIPVMMFSHTVPSGTEESDVYEALFKGYPNGDTSFGQKYIDLYWCDPNHSWKKIEIPSLGGLTSKWYVELQGTSTMRNRVKNFSLGLETANNEYGDKMLVSPNYNKDDTSTFLPEAVWTIKADIADSAHANNTSIGKFVNSVCTKFDTGENHPGYIKNTLEGFPVMLFFQINDTVYYLGVYNFNMGRNSYYNLGYYTADDTYKMINSIYSDSDKYGPFAFSYGSAQVVRDLSIAEVQDNQPQFGFHQYNRTVLFQDNNSETTKMFGKENKITYGDTLAKAQGKIENFVESVAKAGAYCFASIKKNDVPSMQNPEGEVKVWDVSKPEEANGFKCEDKYTIPNQVPDTLWQMRYDASDNITWKPDGFSYDNIDVDDLFGCICNRLANPEESNIPTLNYTSASEYYTICMAFAMVDSVCKNMNIKSWNEITNYIAFYDMDCGLGEDNSGDETVSYLAAMDYWHSEEKNGSLKDVDIDWDYWNNDIGVGFDAKSSYLFAIVKYAQALLGEGKYGVNLTRYPQHFWAELRKKDGELRDADHFVDTYFKSGIGTIPTYLAALNYQVKYLYTGTVLDDKGKPTSTRHLALANGFHGSRVFKVRDWLRKRLHILDMMFNTQGISREISTSVYTPKPNDDLLNDLRDNPDVTILQSAFSTNNQNTALISGSFYVKVKAPMNTPVVIKDGSSSTMYLLTKGLDNANDKDNYNVLYFQPTNNQAYQCLGSKEFIDMNIVEPLFTKYFAIESDNLENIVYGGNTIPPVDHEFTITSSSVKNVCMNIPNYTGELKITNTDLYGQAINKIDISNSSFYGSWSLLKNLEYLNISSVNTSEKIEVSDCKKLTGNKCSISGVDAEIPTKVKMLTISDISGDFSLNNTQIEEIKMTAIEGSDATFEINGDPMLTTLALNGFKSVKINNCPNLSTLSIEEKEKNPCEVIEINLGGNYTEYIDKKTFTPRLTKFNSTRDGVFDFTQYTGLKRLGVSGCYGVEVIKIPDHKVSVTTFQNNLDLEFVDTAGQNSCIELTAEATFYMCPRYGMRQSWGKKSSSESIYYTPTRTKMCISEDCTTLQSTFDRVYNSLNTKYVGAKEFTEDTKKYFYINSWGQNVINKSISSGDAKWFINNVVESAGLDDIWIDDDGNITDSSSTSHIYGTIDCSSHITSLQACFKYQSGLKYITPSATIPSLSKYTSLINIMEMYAYTGVTLLTANLLSLPIEMNKVMDDEGNLIPMISWDSFMKTGEMNMTKNALENISYRINSLSNVVFTVKDTTDGKTTLNTDGSEYLDILDVLCVKKDENGDYIPFSNMTSFSMFSISSEQYVDYTKLFECCPNVTSLSGFLRCDLSRAKIDGLLYPCKKLTSIVDSCSHQGDMKSAPTIDLFTFFDWENGYKCTNLFTSSTNGTVGFTLNKNIEYDDFKKIMKSLTSYDKLTRLMNIFSYCTINNYYNKEDGEDGKDVDIILGEVGDNKVMKDITNIDSLFYKCKGLDMNKNNVPLRIRRSFFEKLPNVTNMMNTFNSVHFADMLSLDFFCKRKPSEETISIKIDGVNKTAKLKTYSYNTNISSMNNCFADAKFVECRCWFDIDDKINDGITLERDKIIYNNDEYNGDTYYKTSYNITTEYKISDPIIKRDALNNFTNYEKLINLTLSGSTSSIGNHDIDQDLTTFSNKSDDGSVYPFKENNLHIYPTYCCLPPDIFYGCDNRCDLTKVFANTNIIGVIPQHLMSNCNSGIYEDMWLNTNILPNIFYHYDLYSGENMDAYMNIIQNIPVDNDTILSTPVKEGENPIELNESAGAIVLFRNGDGDLRRRYPRMTGEYRRSQYIYVPYGYTSNNDIKRAFTFRYNLPQQVDLFASSLKEKYNIVWPTGVTKDNGQGYDNTYSPESKPELWPYYTQYFFLNDKSVDWSYVYNMSYPFITDDYDKDYSSNKSRVFSSVSSTDNKWWSGTEVIQRDSWYNKTKYIFNVFLNLCGERDRYTGELKDTGCMISKALDRDNNPQLSNFISGNLCKFLNGKVFDCSGHLLSSANGNGIISFNEFGRNIIFPSLAVLPNDENNKVLLALNKETSQFYDFMFDTANSLNNYKERYFGTSFTSGFLIIENNIKYVVRP